MYPIYETGRGEGIGYPLDSFLERFETICEEHVQNDRAKAFAFIFYGPRDRAIFQILGNGEELLQLDRLSDDNLTIFYLRSDRKKDIVPTFNAEFLSRLEVDRVDLPCIVFFKFKGDGIEDVVAAQLGSAKSRHAFHELYGVIDSYIKSDLNAPLISPRYMKWVKSSCKYIALEVLKAALNKFLDDAL